MSRVKRGTKGIARRKKILEQTEGYRGAKSTLIRTAIMAVMKAGVYAYRDRKAKKRDFRSLWIARISAAARNEGIKYSTLMNGLKLANVDLNRKMLAELTLNDPAAFKNLVQVAQTALKKK